MTHSAPFKLRFTNPYGERFFFCNLGGFWGPDDTRRLIERTTTISAQAREFATTDEAKETLVAAGKPGGWEIMDADGRAVG